jgi:DNA-binding SARP family transcriptional activator/ATP/maltotriose-dependent transcriptional regulator MalT
VSAQPGARDLRRCLLVVAGPGYGKTTALRTWLPPAASRWCEPASVAALLDGQLPQFEVAADGERHWLVLDDVPRLPTDRARALLAWVDGLPDAAGVAIGSRWPLAASVSRGLGRGWLRLTHPTDLSLSTERVAAVLRDDYDLRDPSLPSHLRAATGGWPALVRLSAETLTRQSAPDGTSPVDALVQNLSAPGTAVSAYVEDEVIGSLPADAARLVRDAASFDPLSIDLCRSLGHRSAARVTDGLARIGVLEPADTGRYRLVPVVAAVARRGRRAARVAAQARIAAGWYATHGPPVAAARAIAAAGDAAGCAEALAERGEEILAAGGAATFIELVEALPEDVRCDRVRLLWGDALRATGDTAAALAHFQRLTPDTPDADWDPGLAWRMGMVYYLKAEARTALKVLARADPDLGSPIDRVLVSAWTATAHWMLGDMAASTEHAWQAHRLAVETGDARALAAAHIALAMALKQAGETAATDEHYTLALRAARRAGDMVQLTRILVNQSHEQLARAHYGQALEIGSSAVRVAETAGPAGMLIVAMCNEAEALGRVGRFDDAIERYRHIVSLCQRMGSRRTATALAGLGDVHRRRGWREQARAAYEEAARIARIGGEVQALVPALVGLARVFVRDDPATAAGLVDEAGAYAQGSFWIGALIAQGWVAHARSDRAAALALAQMAATDARQRREPGWLAESLELRAAVETDPASVRAALAEAHAIWRDAGATVDADRLLTSLGNLPDAGTADRLAAMLARVRQLTNGVMGDAAAVPLAFGVGTDSHVQIQVLGRFEVRVGNQPVPATAWQSRKARDLLRILVARRARVVPREELAELLWPDDDPTRTGHRLSVVLSILRTVLDPDRAAGIDQFILADKSGVALDPTWIRIDVEAFLGDVAHGSRLYEQGALEEAKAILTAAEKSYVGDPFADEPYADWAAPLREQARAAYLRTHRTLARLARHAGDADQVHSHLLSILEQDQYDEDAHRTLVSTLVAAGRHGEARRAQVRYREAMAAIGVPVSEELLRL